MASLKSISLQSPGTLGLNTQNKETLQDPRYCVVADNAIISGNGRLESRKGFKKLNTLPVTGVPNMDVVFSYIQNDGTEIIVSTGGNKVWSGTTTVTDETGALTITDDNWQFQNYAGEVFGYNGTDAPIYWDGVAATFATIASKGTAAGIVSSGVHLSAYGRSWVVDTTTPSQISYSDLLVPEDFVNGSAGNIDLNTVWPYSNDTITALAAHNNNLIIFCEKSIVIYGNAHNINNLYLVEVIRDIGCIARDSIQNVGDDILFLAKDGVRSLARTIIQDNMPQNEISKDIRDDIITSIAAETMSLVRSSYNEEQGFYIINFPSVPESWVCDVRLATQGIYRWTHWNEECFGLATGSDNTLYLGLRAGWIAEYDGYYDTDVTDGSLDEAYTFEYQSAWMESGAQTSNIFWKRSVWNVDSGGGTFTFSWFLDFLSAAADTYTYIQASARSRVPVLMSRSGSIIKLKASVAVQGGLQAFNRIDLFFKTGRMR